MIAQNDISSRLGKVSTPMSYQLAPYSFLNAFSAIDIIISRRKYFSWFIDSSMFRKFTTCCYFLISRASHGVRRRFGSKLYMLGNILLLLYPICTLHLELFSVLSRIFHFFTYDFELFRGLEARIESTASLTIYYFMTYMT